MKRIVLILICLIVLPIIALAQDKYMVNTQELNVRSRPSAKSSVVGKLKQGETVTVYAIANGWASIKYKSKSNYSYVSAKYLVKIEPEKKDSHMPDKKDNKKNDHDNGYKHNHESDRDHQKQKTITRENDDYLLSVFIDGFGGMTSYSWSNTRPKPAISYGGDLGFRWKYRAFSHSIPKGLFGDISVGYSHRGCNAFPIDYGTAHLFPLGYSYSFSCNLGVFIKAGGYFSYPITGEIAGKYDTSIDYGVAGSIGCSFRSIELGFSYERGFADVSESAPVSLKNEGLFATLYYHFRIK